MALTQTSAPALLPITLQEVKDHLRVDGTSDDALIEALMQGAVVHAENYLGRRLITQTWKWLLDAWPYECERGHYIRLPYPPLISVTSVKYLDTSGTQQTLATDQYRVLGAGDLGAIEPARDVSWPSLYGVSEQVEIIFVAGYGSYAAAVPEPIRQGMLMLLSPMYESRGAEQAIETPGIVKALWAPFKLWGFGA